MIKIIIPALLIISLVSFIVNQTTIPKPFETPLPEPFKKPKVVSDQFVQVRFKEGVNVTEFAEKYNIDTTKIEGPSLAQVYRIPIPQGESVLSAKELFKKDPDVIDAKFEVYAAPQ